MHGESAMTGGIRQRHDNCTALVHGVGRIWPAVVAHGSFEGAPTTRVPAKLQQIEGVHFSRGCKYDAKKLLLFLHFSISASTFASYNIVSPLSTALARGLERRL